MIVLLSSKTKLLQTSNWTLVKYCAWGEGFVKIGLSRLSADLRHQVLSFLLCICPFRCQPFVAGHLSSSRTFSGSVTFARLSRSSVAFFSERKLLLKGRSFKLDFWFPPRDFFLKLELRCSTKKVTICFHGKRPKRPKTDAKKKTKTVFSFELFWSIDVFSEP